MKQFFSKKQYKNIFKYTSVFVFFVLFFSVSHNASAATLTKPANNLGLVGYWSFNDATSTTATDFSGSGNTGTLTNMANPGTATSGWGTGKLGGGLNFDGSNDYVSVTDPSSFSFGSGDFTVSVWFKSGGTNGLSGILNKRADASTGIGILLNTDSSGNSSAGNVFVNVGGSYTATSGKHYNDNTWHHLLVRRLSGNVLVYVDNVQVLSFASVGNFTTTSNFLLGYPVISGSYFSGSLDEVRVYSRALSVTEVSSLYNSGAQKLKQGVSNNGLVGYWSFNDATSTTATDFSGNGNTGTLTNMANPGTATSGWGNGKLGGGLNFDGSNDYMLTSSAPTLTNTVTFSFWVKTSQTEAQSINYPISLGSSGTDYLSVWVGGTFGDSQVAAKSIGLYVGASSVGASAATGSFTTTDYGRWHHIVVTYDANATTKTKIYKDNVLLSMSTNNITGPIHSINQVRIGSRVDGAWYFNGSIDEVRLYDRALSATEISALYNSGAQKINASRNVTGTSLDSGLVGLWSFDGKDMNGTTAYDRSGSGNNGTLTNGPVPAIGKMGQGLSFDGTNDYVDASGFSATRSLSNPSTVSAWVKPTSADLDGTWHAVAGSKSVAGEFGTSVAINSSKYICVISKSGISDQFVGTVSAVANQWALVTTVWDGTNLSCYVNGVLDTSTVPNGTVLTANNSTTAGFVIGKIIYSGSTFYLYQGGVDDVRLYNRALSANEVKLLYNLGK